MPREPDPSDPMRRDTASELFVQKLEAELKDAAVKGAQAGAVAAIAEDRIADAVNGVHVVADDGQEVVEILKWFRFGHLNGRPKEVSRHFGLLAAMVVLMCPTGEQRAVALQKLLEAKDAAVRSVLP